MLKMYNFNKPVAIVLSFQILLFITSISGTDIPQLPPPTLNKTSTNISERINSSHDVPSKTKILTEGGEISTPIKSTVNNHFGGREGEVLITNSNNIAPLKVNVTITPSSAPKIESQAHSPEVNSSASNTTLLTSIPIYDKLDNTSKEITHKAISPRKGVDYTDYHLNTSTIKPKPKKPTVTVAANEQPYMASHFQPLSKSNSSETQSIPKVPNFDMLNENNQGNTQKYVVPIVIVILSVPFVAIIISILYKRGSEWWKYRHYRRMDFLINGMYDN